MSALAVAFSLKGERDPVELTSILIEAQSDRGPDETSQWSDAGVSLAVSHLFRSPGHRVQDHRVHTTVEDCIVAWDGRLDNRRELLAALGLPADEVIADAAVLARGWRAWGRALPERLRGDFAFVLWDVREQVLFAARDPLGARPLYYVSRSDYFAVASDDEALIRLPGVSADWHPDRLFYRDHPRLLGLRLAERVAARRAGPDAWPCARSASGRSTAAMAMARLGPAAGTLSRRRPGCG